MTENELKHFIVRLAGPKHRLMRAPLRVAYKVADPRNGLRSLQRQLSHLEDLGMIVRHKAYIVLLPRIRQTTKICTTQRSSEEIASS